MSAPLTCPYGHAMDEGLFECPCCGAYRPSANDPDAVIENGRVVGSKRRGVIDTRLRQSFASPTIYSSWQRPWTR